ncbi:hypothetical protein CRX72_12995 [Pantoea sp. BRM17]|nr:hypothetical protein CRX72_12995 [Pantoea sp. BRM17]
MHLTQFPAADIEHFLYQHGFRAVYHQMAHLPLNIAMTPRRIITQAIHHSRCWLLVEGETEVWIVNELARQQGDHFAAEGIRVIEFAQAGLKPLLKFARRMGIAWHVLTDGDEAGKLLPLQRLVTTNSGELVSQTPLENLCRLVREASRVAAWRIGEAGLSAEDHRRIAFHIRVNRPAALFAWQALDALNRLLAGTNAEHRREVQLRLLALLPGSNALPDGAQPVLLVEDPETRLHPIMLSVTWNLLTRDPGLQALQSVLQQLNRAAGGRAVSDEVLLQGVQTMQQLMAHYFLVQQPGVSHPRMAPELRDGSAGRFSLRATCKADGVKSSWRFIDARNQLLAAESTAAAISWLRQHHPVLRLRDARFGQRHRTHEPGGEGDAFSLMLDPASAHATLSEEDFHFPAAAPAARWRTLQIVIRFRAREAEAQNALLQPFWQHDEQGAYLSPSADNLRLDPYATVHHAQATSVQDNPMILDHIDISGFRGINQLSLPLTMTNLLIGENAWGKSSLLAYAHKKQNDIDQRTEQPRHRA